MVAKESKYGEKRDVSPRLNKQKLNDKVAKSWKTAEFVESVAGKSTLTVLLQDDIKLPNKIQIFLFLNSKI